MENSAVKDLLIIDKPKGISSFGAIKILRRKYGIKKMGHAGTLDPLASGLMLVGVGKGTKKLKDLIGLPKVYDAEIILGIKTSTADMEGDIMEEKPISEVDGKNLEKVLSGMTGKINLPVPAYSAIKVRGERLYKMAREGREVAELPIKTMEIFWIKNRGIKKYGDFMILDLKMEVKSGTYIRSIAEEIGRRMGIPTSIKELRRTKIGEFKIEDAEKI